MAIYKLTAEKLNSGHREQRQLAVRMRFEPETYGLACILFVFWSGNEGK